MTDTLPSKLHATLENIEDSCSHCDNFGRRGQWPSMQPPLVALSPVKAVVAGADGSLVADDTTGLLDASGHPIADARVVGRVSEGSAWLDGHGHGLAWAIVNGRIAIEHAAQTTRIQ